MSAVYAPQERTAEILLHALNIVNSVPYRVSARWVFYRLYQAGFYKNKADYKNKFLPAVSAARHAEFGGWQPDTLADETRAAIVRGDGYRSAGEWLAALATGVQCQLDRWHDQPYYVELWYEARAMTDQFRFYTKYPTLRPMGGQPSIPYKYQTAKELEAACKPVIVLYFGDLDEAGSTIAQTVEQDVRKWCTRPFEFVRCGLNADQVVRYNLPENFEHPGSYQWEALPDNAAREIITEAMDRYVDPEAFSVTAENEERATRWLRSRLTQIANEYRLGGAA